MLDYQNFLLVFMYVYIVDFAKSKVDDLAMILILMIVGGLDAAKAEMNIKTCPCKETCSRFQTK